MNGLFNGNGNRHNGNQAVADLDLEATRQEMNALVGLDNPKRKSDDDLVDQDSTTYFQDSPSDTETYAHTERKFWEKGSSHVLFIGIGAALVMGLLVSVYNGIAGGGGGNPQIAAKPESTKNDFFGTTTKDGVGDWKTQAALAEQKAQFQNRTIPDTKKVVAIKTPPAPTPPKPAYTSLPPVIRTAYVPPAPSFHEPETPSIPTAPFPVSRLNAFPTAPAPVIAAPTFDETQKKWEALGKIASWGAEDGFGGGFQGGGYTPAVARSNQLLAQTPQNNTPLGDESSIFSGVPRKTIPIGSSAPGHLDTPVVTTGQNTNDRFIVSLSKALTASDGSVVLPQGSQLIVKVDSVLNGLLELSAVSTRGSDGNDIALPQGAIQIRGKAGKPLVAKNLNRPRGGGNGLLRNLGMFALGGLTSSAQLFGQAASTVSVANGATTITNSPNYLGGLISGGTNAVIPGIQQSFQNNGNQYNQPNQGQLWSVDSGTPVEIFVNQTVAI